MFPATATSRPAARKIAPSSSVVVVFPFVPVTPTNRVPAGQQPPAELDLRPDRDAALARRLDERLLARHARRLHDEVDAVEQATVVLVPERPVDLHDLVAALSSAAAAALPERASAVDEHRSLHHFTGA